MDPPFTVTVTQEQYHLFYRRDRELFGDLVINLSRDPKETMHVLAFWLWLNGKGFRDVILKIHESRPYVSINELANETVTCLNCIHTNSVDLSFEDDDDNIPLMRSILGNKLSLKLLYHNKDVAVRGVAKVLNEVCQLAFGDIVPQINQRKASECVMERRQITCSEDLEGDKSNVTADSSDAKLGEVEGVSSPVS